MIDKDKLQDIREKVADSREVAWELCDNPNLSRLECELLLDMIDKPNLNGMTDKLKKYEDVYDKTLYLFTHSDGSGRLVCHYNQSPYNEDDENVLYSFDTLNQLNKWLDYKNSAEKHVCCLCEGTAFHMEDCSCVRHHGKYLCKTCSYDVLILREES